MSLNVPLNIPTSVWPSAVDEILDSYAVFTMNVSSKSIPNLWGMPACNNKEKAPVPKPIKANLKPKPKLEVPGNR